MGWSDRPRVLLQPNEVVFRRYFEVDPRYDHSTLSVQLVALMATGPFSSLC